MALKLLRASEKTVISTLDARLQRFVIEVLKHHLTFLRARNVRDGAVLVAEKEGRLVGFVLVSRARFMLDTSRNTGAITDIYVEPDERRTGIGSRLLATGLEWLKARGYVRVLLNVSTGNPARRLYEKAGFRPFSESMEIDLD